MIFWLSRAAITRADVGIVRDPERIPMVLAAIEREWRKHPDQRLGQLLVNVFRRRGTVPSEDESQVLFAVEDAELLRWLGAETDDEQRYVEDERQDRQVGWREWMHACEHHEAEDDES
jgi:hypothetical protein